ncbi:MAG: c-type cytochrome biogenesis protein CcsB [Thermoleophilia bacterium]|nr:c-type cytochrome biogenesis protein CcsB [Thermoleophilia bacterium]
MDLIKLEEILFIAAIFSYLVCSGIYIWYLVSRNRKAASLGTALLALGLTAHTVALILRWITSGHAPMANHYESLSVFGWAIMLFYLTAEKFYPIRAAGALVVPSGFIISSVALVFYSGPEPLAPALQSIWLWIHVSIAMLSYGLFALSFGVGFIYVVQEYLLKKNYDHVMGAFLILFALLGLVFGMWAGSYWAEPARVIADESTGAVKSVWSGSDYAKMFGGAGVGLVLALFLGYAAGKGASRQAFAKRLPSLDVLDEVSYRGIAFGFPLLTIGIVTGAIWADQAWGRWWGWDPKETWSLITWLFYGAYLHTRLTMGWRGRHSAVLAIAGIVVVMFTYLGVNLFLSGLHSYA